MTHPKQVEAANKAAETKAIRQKRKNMVESFKSMGIRFVNNDRVVVAYRNDGGSMLVSTAVRNRHDRADHDLGKTIAADRLIAESCIRLPIFRDKYYSAAQGCFKRERVEQAMKRQAQMLLI